MNVWSVRLTERDKRERERERERVMPKVILCEIGKKE